MAIDAYDLVNRFGAAAELGVAALFVGAGLSRGAGLPDWNDLMEMPRARAGVPAAVRDLPLVAEYYEQDPQGGRASLMDHLLRSTAAGHTEPSEGHRLLAKLPVREIWTTNFDPLIERYMPEAQVVSTDDEMQRVGYGRRSVVKMHGSI